MRSSSISDSQFGLEMVPLDHPSPLVPDDRWQLTTLPTFDLTSTDPLPTIDENLANPEAPVTAPPPATVADKTTEPGDSSGSVWMDGNALSCTCPECQAPMSIRLWLMIADCWSCQTSIELSEEMERAARQLWEQRRTGGQQTTGQARATSRATLQPAQQIAIPVAGPSPKASFAQAKIRRQTELQGTEIWVTNLFKDTPAWLISLIFHVVVLTLLGIFNVPVDPEDKITLSMTESYFVREGGTVMDSDPKDELTLDVPVPKDVDLEDPEEREMVMQQIEEAKELREDFDSKNRDLPKLRDVKRDIREADSKRMTLAARDPRVRVEMVTQEGGTTRTEAAVARGLRWLSQHQNTNGSWSLRHNKGKNACACGNPGTMTSDSAATSLALLPFLGAGQTPETGKYKRQVKQGLDWLVSIQKSNGDLRYNSQSNSGMYAHGQGAIVLCEAYLLSGNKKLKKPAQAAINFIVTAQHPKGGWRYQPGQAGDTSVMGWQVMALHSARAAGLHVPDYTVRDAKSYLDRADPKKRGLYGYQPGAGPTHPMTAEGLLCRMYLGWDKNKYQEGINFLAKGHPPDKNALNLYYLYYASQVFHHVGGEQWADWNFLMQEALVQTQEVEGHALGSWTPKDHHDRRGGRLYTTAMAVCCLEVYYRHLPLFRQIKLD